MMYRQFGRPRPQLSGFGTGMRQAPTGPTAQPQTSYQAQYRPDFLQQKPSEPQPFSRPKTEITSNYERAHAELLSPHLHQGPMTEKQSRDLAWQSREDPRGVREQLAQNRRVYGSSTPPQQQPQRPAPPTSRSNYQGPRGRFNGV